MIRPAALSLVVLLVGCELAREAREAHGEPSRSERVSAEIPDVLPKAPVAGQLGGEAFHAQSARYRIERLPGRERIDLFLSEQPAPSQCFEAGRSEARSVWVRFEGMTSLTAGGRSAEELSGAATFHYEHLRDGIWRGRHDGEGRIRIEREGTSHIEGRLYVCFGTDGCLGGRFEAERCRSVLDVDRAGGGHTGRGTMRETGQLLQ